MLAFWDTGLSVTDGVTLNGLWSVTSQEGLGWEYSLDMGMGWIRGGGDSFLVTGDGPKTIWAQARYDQGNTSEIVVVQSTPDTRPPAAVDILTSELAAARLLRLGALEPEAIWEYSPDNGISCCRGTGDALAVAGNALPLIRLRQVDLAGNPSLAAPVALDEAGAPGWIKL